MAEVKSELQMRNSDGTLKRDYLATRIVVEHRKKRRKAREDAEAEPEPEPEPDPNLLAALPWVQGTNTTMSTVGGRVRALYSGGNPRVYKHITGLTPGNYRVRGSVWQGNAAGRTYYFRVSTNSGLVDGNVYQEIFSGAEGALDDIIAVAGTALYIGVVGVVFSGEYVEIDEDFELIAI